MTDNIKPEAAPASPDEWETPCPEREDGIHCNCWYDGDRCCACGARDIFNYIVMCVSGGYGWGVGGTVGYVSLKASSEKEATEKIQKQIPGGWAYARLKEENLTGTVYLGWLTFYDRDGERVDHYRGEED